MKKLEVTTTKRNLKIKNQKESGITLIALIVTIIVLLILTGVSIATLTGDNGLLSKTQQAKEENEKASDRDKIAMAVSEAQIGNDGYQELNSNTLQEAIDNQFNGRNIVTSNNEDGTFTVSCLDTLRDYIISGTNIEEGIDWNEAMSNAVAPKSQDEARNEGVIGIGTDGKPVDMDLWEYTLLENDTFGLNDEEALEDVNKTPGYLFGENGENIIDGKIIGTVPQYISIDRGETWKPVSDMTSTFCENDILISAPYIPQTVTKMLNTFIRCINLKSIQNLPQSLVDLGGAFKQTSIEKIMYLPDSIENLGQTFYNCNKITNIPNIPKRLIKMNQAFECTEPKKLDIF